MGVFRKRPIRYPLLVLFLLGAVAAILIMMWNVWVGIAFIAIYSAAAYYTVKVELLTYVETEKHIQALSYRMEDVGKEAFLEMPFGILLMNDEMTVEWANPFMLRVLQQESLVGYEMEMISEELPLLVNQDQKMKRSLPSMIGNIIFIIKKKRNFSISLILQSKRRLKSNIWRTVQYSLFYLSITMMSLLRAWMIRHEASPIR